MKISDVFSFAVSNWQSIVVLLLGLIGAASMLIKALENLVLAIDKIVELLVAVFPGLRKADGTLKHIAAFLAWLADVIGALGKSGLLNSVAMSPAPAKALLLLLALVTLTPTRSYAQSWSSGPTLPLLQIRLAPEAGAPPVTQLAAGAGYQLSAGFLPKVILGKQVDLLQASLAAVAGLTDKGGAASLALMGCTLSDLICIGFGADLIAVGPTGNSGLLLGKVGRQNLFALLSLGFAVDPGPHASAVAPKGG